MLSCINQFKLNLDNRRSCFKQINKPWGYSLNVENLPRFYNGPGSNPNTEKKRKLVNKKQADEMVQWLRALAPLPENPDLIPSTHMIAHNYH